MGSAREQLGRASAGLFRGYGEIASFNQNNVEALMQAGSIFVRGAEDLGKLWIDMTQRSLEDSAALAKAMAGARSLQDVASVQNDLARSILDGFLNESLRMSEVSARVASEAAAPIQARVNAALERMVKRPAAA